MMVVFHHAIGQMESRGGRDLGFDVSVGQAGVDLFFVISGFIMVFVTQGRNQTSLEFWRNRIYRIVPLYWFFTLTMAIITLVVPTLLKTAEFNSIHILKSLFFIPTHHPNFENMVWPLLVQGWTLNYEMFFYLIFGILLPVKNFEIRMILLAALLIGLVVLGAVIESKGPIWETYTSPLLLEFLAGALIGVAYNRGYLVRGLGVWACLVLGVFLFSIEGWAQVRALDWGLPSMLVVVAAIGLETKNLGNLVPRSIGDASYSIYLSHTFTLGAVGVIWARFGDGSPMFDGIMFLLALTSSAALGILSYVLIERPTTRWLQR